MIKFERIYQVSDRPNIKDIDLDNSQEFDIAKLTLTTISICRAVRDVGPSSIADAASTTGRNAVPMELSAVG